MERVGIHRACDGAWVIDFWSNQCYCFRVYYGDKRYAIANFRSEFNLQRKHIFKG